MSTPARRALVWFRRDLRLHDNAALSRALADADEVVPVFVFDAGILAPLPRADRRVGFIHGSIAHLKAALQGRGSDLVVRHGDPRAQIPALAAQFDAAAVYANEDYEPAARERDAALAQALQAQGRELRLSADTAVFAPTAVLTRRGEPYTVFTPYRNAWFRALAAEVWQPYPADEAALGRLARLRAHPLPSMSDLGFDATASAPALEPGTRAARARLQAFVAHDLADYAAQRDIPGRAGTSGLSVYNRFGCLSVRELVAGAMSAMAASPTAQPGGQAWLSELAWRDFYFQLLYHFPHVVTRAFRPEFEHVAWDNDEARFAAWCEARTGFPIVDAAMTQLNTTGFMHNRLRMVAASFLTKDLLIDWRWGEAYYARKLMDYDLAANNGNWQWVASTGCDPQPYFRVFNPSRQSERFDPDAVFIHDMLPALRDVPARYLHEPWRHEQALARHGVRLGRDYPHPIVEHGPSSRRAVRAFELARAAAQR